MQSSADKASSNRCARLAWRRTLQLAVVYSFPPPNRKNREKVRGRRKASSLWNTRLRSRVTSCNHQNAFSPRRSRDELPMEARQLEPASAGHHSSSLAWAVTVVAPERKKARLTGGFFSASLGAVPQPHLCQPSPANGPEPASASGAQTLERSQPNSHSTA